MADGLFDKVYNPDVLSCLANLSNDEVFTPPDVANQMLDMLPQELFQNPDTTFLDPACKSGIFLREIAKRLIVGLEPQFSDLQERVDHIFHHQLYGISITELTSLLSRRGGCIAPNIPTVSSQSRLLRMHKEIFVLSEPNTPGKMASASSVGRQKTSMIVAMIWKHTLMNGFTL